MLTSEVLLCRVHSVRLPNPVASSGDAHQQRSTALHGALPLPAHAYPVGTTREYPTPGATTASLYREGGTTDRSFKHGKNSYVTSIPSPHISCKIFFFFSVEWIARHLPETDGFENERPSRILLDWKHHTAHPNVVQPLTYFSPHALRGLK